MIYSKKIEDAIRIALQIHEVDSKQKRKGKDIPYIVHPLAVALILARASADEDTIVAGILHDTIEDSLPEHKVTRETIASYFCENIAATVESVTESDKTLPWAVRKAESLNRIKNFSHSSLLVKSADVISNASELIEDFKRHGEAAFDPFNATKEQILEHYRKIIAAILDHWQDNPLKDDLRNIDTIVDGIKKAMVEFPKYYDVDDTAIRVDSDGEDVWGTVMATGWPYPPVKASVEGHKISEEEAKRLEEVRRKEIAEYEARKNTGSGQD